MILALHITADLCIIGLTASTIAGYVVTLRAERKRRKQIEQAHAAINDAVSQMFGRNPGECDCERCTAPRAEQQARAN